MPMQVTPMPLDGVVLIEPQCFEDARGYFFESFSQARFDALVRPIHFVQDNESCSVRGVVRGLHFQRGSDAQSKLVRVVEGTIWDVAVDLRRGSPTFGQHVSVELSAENRRQLFIPRGFAHGFAVLSERAVVQYKCDRAYAPQSEGGVAWNDPSLAIPWPVAAEEVILSAKDAQYASLDAAGELFDYETDYYAE